MTEKLRRSSRSSAHSINLNSMGATFFNNLKNFFDKAKDNDIGSDIRIGNQTLSRVHRNPDIYIIPRFLSTQELDYLVGVIGDTTRNQGWQESFVFDDDDIQFDKDHRSSKFHAFESRQNKRVAMIESKVCDFLSCDHDAIEPLQLVRYVKGEKFGVHHDMGTYNEETDTVELPYKSTLAKRRILTIFCYLNDVPNGGGYTHFPACDGLRIRPKAGQAVVFSNVTKEGLPDKRTIHEGDEVTAGEKYGLNIWVTER